jgi:hypothetical protein
MYWVILRVMSDVSPAVRELRSWLFEKKESQTAFAARTGIDRVVLLRILSGKTRRINADIAARIVEGTRGGVPIAVFKRAS